MSKAREGWSWGTTDSGEWLTILGSHWSSPTLYDTAEEATLAKPVALDQPWNADRAVLAYVRETYHPGVTSGQAYCVLKTERGA